jgi:diguanylate cyclase (GGDEF)-like protein
VPGHARKQPRGRQWDCGITRPFHSARDNGAGGDKLPTESSIINPRLVNRARGVVLCLAALTAGLSLTAEGNFAGGVAIALAGSLYVLLTALSGALEEGGPRCQIAVTVGDVLLITAIIWISGGVQSEYYLLYYIPVVIAGARLDVRSGAAACLLAGALYALAAFNAPAASPVLPFAMFRVITVCVSAVVLLIFLGLLQQEAKVSDDLRDTLHHSLRRVAAVYDVAHAANTGADLTGVLSIILDHAARATGAANGSVFLLADGQLKAMASLSTASSGGEPLASAAIEPARRAIAARSPITITGGDEPQGSHRDATTVYVPLFTPAGAVGALSLASPSSRGFSRKHLDFLMSVGAEAALAVENAELRSELRRLAVTDHLTGLPNRRETEGRLSAELERAARYDHSLSLLMIDVDDLKKINDDFGHAVGDEVLRALASLFRKNIRSSELAGRLGGDEFAVVLPETDCQQATALAERLIKGLPQTLRRWPSLPDPERVSRIAGISIGVASNEGGLLSADQLSATADAALYEAKRQGKSRAWIGSPPQQLALSDRLSPRPTL